MLGQRDSVSGAMRIPVEAADLAELQLKRVAPPTTAPKPPARSPRRAPAEQPNPLGRILPVH
jgi:hypothetical protein